jgi:GTP-binding protein
VFHDRAKLTVSAGKGGDGSMHFRREKFVPKGGPDGGDGGDGGSVVLISDPRRRDLSGIRPNQTLRAERGGNGGGSLSTGETGADAELAVPVGTQVLDADGRLIADLATPGVRIVVAKGGIGGRGNKRFANPTRQTPKFAEIGMPGEEGEIELHLKLVADAAMAGFPNAGKSSLLARISNARPKVADYPFTTLAPNLGTVEAPDGRQLTVADVPGLIEGASEGIGLGHEFLAHLERARLLLHVIDSSEEDLEARWRTIDNELAAYGAGLDTRPQVVVLNKIDLSPEPPAFDVDDERIVAVFRVSAATGAGIDDLKRALFTLAPEEAVVPLAPADGEELVDYLVYRPQPARRGFRIFRTEGGFRVTGTPPPSKQLEAILKQAGAREGDAVEIGEDTLEWQ